MTQSHWQLWLKVPRENSRKVFVCLPWVNLWPANFVELWKLWCFSCRLSTCFCLPKALLTLMFALEIEGFFVTVIKIFCMFPVKYNFLKVISLIAVKLLPHLFHQKKNSGICKLSKTKHEFNFKECYLLYSNWCKLYQKLRL